MNHLMNMRWGKKFLLFFGTFLFIVGGINAYSNINEKMLAETKSTGPSFQLYDKVKLANKEYTVIGTGDHIKLLSDSDTGNNVTWNNAKTELTSFSTTLGDIGKIYTKDKFSMPLFTELPITNNELHTSIPKLSNDWWLGDSTIDNKNKFIDTNNRTDGEVEFNTTIINDSKECDIKNETEVGQKVNADYRDETKTEIIPDKQSGTVSPYLYSPTGTYPAYSDHECKSPIINTKNSSPAKMTITNYTSNFTLKNGKIVTSGMGSTQLRNAAFFYRYYNNDLSKVSIWTGTSNSSNRHVWDSEICLSFENTTDTGTVPSNYDYWSSSTIGSIKTVVKNSFYHKLVAKNLSSYTLTCPGQTHEAGTSLVRPKIEVPLSDIVWGGNSKRIYQIESQIKDSFPISDGNNYLTLKTNAMNISLQSGAEGVDGNTITMKRDNNGKITLPVSISGSSEGTQYIGIAMNQNGTEKYAIVKQVTNANETLEFDISNINNYDQLTELNLTLYVEDSGSYDTSYISMGKQITVTIEEDVIDTIPDGWVLVSPDANTNGWNHENVTISLSQEAKDQGYTSIEVVNDSDVVQKSGEEILYDSETDGITPKVRLKKGDATTNSNPVRTIKIDKTSPSASITIDQEADWAVKKTMTISAVDSRSGIDTVVVEDPDGGKHTITLTDDKYIYDVMKEGTYKITITDLAGNVKELTKEIIKIDTTTISLSADKEKLDIDQPKQKITLTYQAGTSGIKTFKVFYKQSGEDYQYLENINVLESPMDWYAEMNGWFKFELINNAGEKAEAEVEITQVNPPKPVTKIHATYQDDSAINYRSDTWTNHNITITLSNANEEIKDPVIFEYSEDGTTWQTVNNETLTIETTTLKETTLQFKSKVSDDIQEESIKSFTVKIDKTKPDAPIVMNKEDYTSDTWYQDSVTVETKIIPKTNNLNQTIYVCSGTKDECSKSDASWEKTNGGKKEFSEKGSQEVYFKSIDEAGNVSDFSEAIFININNEEPVITIKLKQNPIKSLINDLTFGFFYQDSVDIDIEVDFGEHQGGDVYYIIDKGNKGKPEDASNDWIKGTHTSLDPEAEAMIYVKAVSKAGVVAREDSIYRVYADSIAPVITVPDDMSTWSKEASIELSITDALSGVDQDTIRIQQGSKDEQSLTLKNGKAKLTNLMNGEYAILVKAKDYSGNERSETVKVKIDTELPQISTPVSDHEGWADQKTITFHATDAFSKVASVKITDSLGNEVSVDHSGNDSYQFVSTHNDTYTITVIDHAGNQSQISYTSENIKDDEASELSVIAENKGKQIQSGTWVNGEILFTISGGLNANLLEKYQVAITNGIQPTESDWQDLNQSNTHQHIVTGNVNGKSYWFRVVPTDQGVNITNPFIVNLDNEAPHDVQVHKTSVNSDPISKFINALSFGQWLKETQFITFDAQDNFTPANKLRFEYAEERDGVLGTWQEKTADLSYEETDIILHVRAIDLAGNVSLELPVSLQIDQTPPEIDGVKDQSEYKQYYLPRFVTVTDPLSGLKQATYQKNNTHAGTFTDNVETPIRGQGTYEIYAIDEAGNEITVTFKIVKLPDIETEIDGSDESRDIIDQIIKELEEVKNKIDPNEKDNYEKWIKDAEDKWESLRTKVIEDDKTTSKVEGQGDTTFDPKTELIVKEIPKEQVPVLPKHAIKTYDVYLKKGNTIIQPDGSVKVYLPYDEEETPIVYEISDDGTVRELTCKKENGYVTFVTNTLKKYAISNTAQEDTKKDVCVVGPDGKLNSKDDVCGSGDSIKNEDGSITVPDGGKVIFPDKEIDAPDGAIINPDGSVDFPDGTHYDPEGNEVKKPDPKPNPDDGKQPNPDDGKNNQVCAAGPDGKLGTADDVCGEGNGTKNPDKESDGSVTIPDGGSVIFPDGSEIELPDGGIIKPDGSVELPDGTIFNPDGTKKDPDKKKECSLEEKKELNIDTDGDGIPDINLDINGDCKPELNIDVNDDGIPDIDIDTTGNGKADINIDTNKDGKPDLNIVLHLKWKPNVTYTVNGFTYNTMKGLIPDLNVDDDGDGSADRNVDTDGDDLPDVNVDDDWFSKRGIKNPNKSTVQGTYTNGTSDTGGASTSDHTKWSIWLITLIITMVTMLYTLKRKQKNMQ